ncbi:MAG TPA: SAM-dependent methyltransferase [Lentimicrobium sp.]|nr:SAM-dependent methyltransferase [Lentimicrobium sp.]
MNSSAHTIEFINRFEQSMAQALFIKLTLSNKRTVASELNNVYVKPVLLRELTMLSFTYRYKTKDITKNFELREAISEIQRLLSEDFTQGYLATTINDYQLLLNRKGNSTLLQKPPASTTSPSMKHDKVKERIIETGNTSWMSALGIMNKEGVVKTDMQDKYKQINKYIEIVDGILKGINLPDNLRVADMGSGKGYLTFAMYDYLTSKQNKQVVMTGIELRRELVEKCNQVAVASKFTGLSFQEGTIEKASLPEIDMLIALHACDTATDEAIYKGIRLGARVIVCSPCCHKQVRKSLETRGALAEITQYGILAERQAEILTDTIRALILEAHGYRTNVAEFVATEHTPKNLIISAVKKKLNPEYHSFPDPDIMKNIEELKNQFSIRSHYLQDLLQKKD